ncbi:MAG: hypothetical protein REI78_12255 [Pedobacter sp.]|nr:hypothetical protein [Pedobacter sp.]MDQ8053796.1 hypothetical protein [Pedobacter sp.]
MNNEVKKKNEKTSSNFLEPQPKGKVDQGNKAVKKTEDQIYQEKPAEAKTKNPAKAKERSEQPVHPIQKA